MKEIEHMPNQKWHKYVSFIKSGVRILGYCLIPFNLGNCNYCSYIE
jgi:hypothetical protein